MATSSNGAMKLCDNTKDKLQLLVQHGAEGIFQSAIEWYHEKKKKKKKGKEVAGPVPTALSPSTAIRRVFCCCCDDMLKAER